MPPVTYRGFGAPNHPKSDVIMTEIREECADPPARRHAHWQVGSVTAGIHE
jgi:hypothetical protein